MSVILTENDIPKSCGGCNARDTSVCQKWMSMDRHIVWSERHEDCPLKSAEGLIEKIIQAHQYKGKSENIVINAQNIGLDRYFDLGLEKAIKIIKEYCEVKE